MNIKKWFKDFKFRIKVFAWYLLTEPFRQAKQMWIAFARMLDALNKTITWSYIALAFGIIALFLGKRNEAAMFLAFLLFVILLWEWERGHYMHQYRQSYKNRIRKEVEKNERNKKYPIRDEYDDRGRDTPISGSASEDTYEFDEEDKY